MSRVTWRGAQALAAMRAGAAAGLQAAGKMVFDASQERVPQDTSELKESGKLEVDEAQLRAEISYGEGLPDPRAVISHEKLEIQHDDGTAKYLENPMTEMAGEVGEVVAASIRKNLGG